MAQKITIDLKKNLEVADLVADLEPSAKVFLRTAIASKDEDTLVLQLEEASDTHDGLAEDDTDDEDEDDEEDEDEDDDESEKTSPVD